MLMELGGEEVGVMVGGRAREPTIVLHHTGRVLARAPVHRGEPEEQLVLVIGPEPGTKLFLERARFEGAMLRSYEPGARKLSLMLGPLEVAFKIGYER